MSTQTKDNTTKKQEGFLFHEFPPVTDETWENQIKKDLKGADYIKKLVWKTSEGFDVKPYYRLHDTACLESLTSLEPGSFPFVRGKNTSNNDWEIREDIVVDDFVNANRQALDALNKGASSLGFCFGSIVSDEEVSSLLKGIILEIISVNFIVGEHSPFTANSFCSEVNRQKLNTAAVRGSFDYDPVLQPLITGESVCWKVEKTADFVTWIKQQLPQFKALTVNAQHFHEAGATTVQELAFALSAGNEYLSRLTDHNLNVDDIASRMQFNFAFGTNYFFEIAKIRAARLLWSTIVDQYKPSDVAAARMHIHAVSSLRYMTLYDPYVNILRSTTEAMSAGIAGVDSMFIHAFDKIYKTSDEFSSRIARNIQLILKHESYIDKVIDPSGGAYYLEELTHTMAREAWKLFLEIEKAGGFSAACKESMIQDGIAESVRKSDMNIAMRKEIFLGTNQYPNEKEQMLDRIEGEKGIALEARPPYIETKPIKNYRPAAAFETLRLATEKHVKKNNKRPSVFLLITGNLAMARARATFSSNFFGCAGFEIIEYPLFQSLEEALTAFQKHQSDFVVLCSSDEAYDQLVPPLCEALVGKSIIIVAGNSEGKTESYKKYGVADFIHARCNVLETLKGFQKKLNII